MIVYMTRDINRNDDNDSGTSYLFTNKTKAVAFARKLHGERIVVERMETGLEGRELVCAVYNRRGWCGHRKIVWKNFRERQAKKEGTA